MAINKVVYGGLTLMDLTSDSVTPADVAEGVTFHDASGVQRTGTASGGGSGGSGSWKDVTGTLTTGNTSVTLSDSSIKTTSTFDFYTDVFGVCPTDVSVSNGSITLTFEAQESDLNVKVRVTNEYASYTHLKWQLLKTRGNPPHAGAIQASEFYISVNGIDYIWGNSSVASSMEGAASSQDVSKLIDGDTTTKYCTVQWGSTQTNECNIIFTLDTPIPFAEIAGYAFVTGGDEPSRDPISWKLFGSPNGSDWVLIDEKTDYNVTQSRETRVNIALYDFKDYLEVTSIGPFIDTGVANSETAYYEVDFEYTNTPGNNDPIFGAMGNGIEFVINSYRGQSYGYAGGTRAYFTETNLQRHIIKADNTGIYIDGILNDAAINWSIATGRNYYLFAFNYYNGTIYKTGNAKIYSAKLYDGSTLVRNFIPAVRKSDSAIGMYDSVNDVFYTNTGSGSFVTN